MWANSYLFLVIFIATKIFFKTRIKKRTRKKKTQWINEKPVGGNNCFCLLSAKLSHLLLGIILYIYNKGMLNKQEMKKTDKNKNFKYISSKEKSKKIRK